MDDAFIRNRISMLRMRMNVSEYKMSTDLGHSNSYIHSISSGKALPSICEGSVETERRRGISVSSPGAEAVSAHEKHA